MQQLTLHFEGFAQEGQPIDVAATRQRTVSEVIPSCGNLVCHAWEKGFSHVGKCVAACRRFLHLCMEWLSAHREQLGEYAVGMAGMLVGLVWLYLAAVLQGGAV